MNSIFSEYYLDYLSFMYYNDTKITKCKDNLVNAYVMLGDSCNYVSKG